MLRALLFAACLLLADCAARAAQQEPPAPVPLATLLVTDPAFGATCNGRADDTAGFAAAIGKANKTGHVVISVPVDAEHPSCQINGELPAITANYVGVAGGGPAIAKIVQNKPGAGLLTWSKPDPSASPANWIYGGSLENVWLVIPRADTSGVGLSIVRPNGFYLKDVLIQNFYSQITIQGGDSVFGVNIVLNGSPYWSRLQPGSNLLHLQNIAVKGAENGYNWPNNITFSTLNWQDNGNSRTQFCVLIDGADGVYLSNGHIGFCGGVAGTADAATGAQLYLAPTTSRVGIQSVRSSNIEWDGNQAGNGIWIPRIAREIAHSFIKDIEITGGDVENAAGNCVAIEEPTAELRFYARVRECQQWGVYASAFAMLTIDGEITRAGWGRHSTVAIDNAAPAVATTTGLAPVANQAVLFYTPGKLPSPLVPNTVYYVSGAPSCSGSPAVCAFKLSASPGGPAMATTTSGSGTFTAVLEPYGGLYVGAMGRLQATVHESEIFGVGWSPPTSTLANSAIYTNFITDNWTGTVPNSWPGFAWAPVMGAAGAVSRNPSCVAMGNDSSCEGAGALALGWGAKAQAAHNFARGRFAKGTGRYSEEQGQYTTDRGRMGVQVSGYNPAATPGRVQAIDTELWASASGSAAVTLTYDGAGPRAAAAGDGGNCLNAPTNGLLTVAIELSAMDLANPANSYSWTQPHAALLNNGGAVTAQNATATTKTSGATAGASTSVSADAANHCFRIAWTPPTGNTDTWWIGAHLHGSEVAQ